MIHSYCSILMCIVMCVLFACLVIFLFFFFKQKTAYEMRISDWSSDVCSSDLILQRLRILQARHLDDDPVAALLDDRRLLGAEFVDTAAHDLGDRKSVV